jgi:hypothetical protein
VDVFLHWSWFLVALYEIGAHDGRTLLFHGALRSTWHCS